MCDGGGGDCVVAWWMCGGGFVVDVWLGSDDFGICVMAG